MGLSIGKNLFKKQSDTFVSTGNGVTVDASTYSLSNFTLFVIATGAVSVWTVVLEGSVDGINFTTIAIHTNLIGSSVAVFPGVNITPCLYFRARCSSLTLGLGTNITSIILGAR